MTAYDKLNEPVIRSPHVSFPPRKVSLNEIFNLKEFLDWISSYYSKYTRQQIIYNLREALNILNNPSIASRYKGLPRSKRRKIMFAVYAILKYVREILNINYTFSTTIVRKMLGLEKEPPKLLDYEEENDIVSQAEEILSKIAAKLPRTSLYMLTAHTAFFTGLRWPEVRFLINNYATLRKLTHEKAAIVEINYLRKSKNAYVTVLPMKLHLMLTENTRKLGVNAHKELREVYGLKFSIMRKAHLAILSQTMNELEIDLLQGRISPKLPEIFSEITREHYVKHLRRIAEKYLQAYQPYINKYLR